MIDDTKYIQDWSDSDKDSLLSEVTANCKITPNKVLACGSRVYWEGFKPESDVDILVYINDGLERPNSHSFEYEGKRVVIIYQNDNEFGRKVAGCQLSVYDLTNRKMYAGDKNDEAVFKSKRG